MSRIGKKIIVIPIDVTMHVADNVVSVRGQKGELRRVVHPNIRVEVKEGNVAVVPRETNAKKAAALWGMSRTIIANMVTGVTNGFEKVLEFEGIGYRANLEGSILVLQLGFSHPVRFVAPKGITFSVVKNTITISGIDKELVGETAARIRALKKPEPYKGKGIRYQGEVIRRKAGKKAATAGA